MNINWFPGHMTKAARLIEDNIKYIDIIIYVLDARAPLATINDYFTFTDKLPVIYALNKADLVPEADINSWVSILTAPNARAVALDSTRSNSASRITALARKLLAEKIEKHKNKGVNYTVKAMVIGVPNTGKSTLINNLCGNKRADTGDKPGVTKGKQWLKAGDYFELLDTPGVLKPKLNDQRLAYHLAYIGCINDDILDTAETAKKLLNDLSEIYPDNLSKRYKTNIYTLDEIARRRGYLLKGGETDTERAAAAVIDDFRKGRLGKIILEKADEYRA